MTETQADLENRFKHHAPDQGRIMKHEIVRDLCLRLAEVLVDVCPDTRERALAIRKVEEAKGWANAAIARSE